MTPFLSFIVVLFILAALFRIDFFFTIFYLFAGLYIFSHIWTQRVFQHLQFRRNFPPRAYLGDEITITLHLNNRSRWPIPWLSVHDLLPVALTSPPFYRQIISLAGQTSLTLHYSLQARARGYYPIGPLSLETGDLFGFKRPLTTHFPADYLIVYPQIIPIIELGLPMRSPTPLLPTPLPLYHDPSRLIGVRPYQHGDTPRHIHWAASAATGRLWVKQFQPAIAREQAIFLNLDREDYAERGYPEPALELAITTAASLAHHTITYEKLPIGLTTVGLDPLTQTRQTFTLTPHYGRAHLMQILEVLARVQSVELGHYFNETVRQMALHLAWGTTIILITSHVSDPILQLALRLKQSGYAMTLISVNPIERRSPNQTHHTAEALGLKVWEVRRELDIERLS